ncbi:MAG: lantibiotic dehydratase C-terminal domain-containing protein [Allosphingosinicella sp.]
MDQDQWLFYKVYLGRYVPQMDFACVQLSRQLQERLAPKQWFFMRYMDGGGPHIRMRWLGAEGRQDAEGEAFQAIVEDLMCELVFTPPSNYRPMVNLGHAPDMGDAAVGAEFGQSFAVRDEYHPEYEAFLGPELIETAHEVFQVSSEIAIKILSDELEDGPSRKSVAPLLMKIVIEELVGAENTGEFLTAYQEYWMRRDGINVEYLVADFEFKAQNLRDTGYRLDAVPPSQEELATRWRACLRSARAAYGDKIPDRRVFPDNLPFRFLHIMNNRLGISILDEAYLAMVLKTFHDGGDW